MAFRSVNFAHLAKFNSAASSDFIDFYQSCIESKIREENSKPSSKTIAPSSFRCDRRTWFRLRGTEPDRPKKVDPTLRFTADIGTACHRIIQSTLKEALGDDWIEVEDYLKEHPIPYEYELTKSEDGLETLIYIKKPAIRFACDGIIRWKGKYYLLEIKTSEFNSFDDLTDVKDQHVDQIKCYGTLLNLHNVLTLYQDRQYGNLKCYEKTISDNDMNYVLNKMNHVQELVDANIAPEPLPKGDSWCTPSHCPYYTKCGQWGR